MNVIQALNDNYIVKPSSFTFFAFFQLFIKRFLLVMKNKLQLKALAKNDPDKANVLFIEISSEKINALLAQQLICAADARCLDANSKSSLRKQCLKTCLYSKQKYKSDSQLLENLNLAGPALLMEKL